MSRELREEAAEIVAELILARASLDTANEANREVQAVLFAARDRYNRAIAAWKEWAEFGSEK